jgi:hypothetical protein
VALPKQTETAGQRPVLLAPLAFLQPLHQAPLFLKRLGFPVLPLAQAAPAQR